MRNPFWAENERSGAGEKGYISELEKEFWLEFIAKYLAPLDKSVVQQEKVGTVS